MPTSDQTLQDLKDEEYTITGPGTSFDCLKHTMVDWSIGDDRTKVLLRCIESANISKFTEGRCVLTCAKGSRYTIPAKHLINSIT